MTTTLPALAYPGFCDGIDVSSVQRIDDADAVRAAGFLFAFVKAAEGLRGRDPAYRRHVDALSGAGLHVGAYAYARVSQGAPAAQARHAYDAATDDGRHVVRLVLDLESAPAETTSGALFDFAVDWLEEARRAGCARPPSPAAIEASAYGAELEACALQSSTCPGYVACRKRVAESHGRKYDGRCVP